MSDTRTAIPIAATEAGALAPLRRPVFRAMWIAILISSMGTWMHDVGAGWLMAGLAPDPFMVSLVQAAIVLPGFFLALPAGALADIVDRRIYLMIVMSWLIVTAGLLGVLTLFDLVTAEVLLGLTFAMGVGTAMMTPAFSALIPDLVPREELTAAITLNSIAMNLTRAAGPALAGVLIALAGPAVVFLYNSVSYLALLAVLIPWRNPQPRSTLPSERLFGAVRTGLRFVRQSPALKTVLVKTLAFVVMGAALWAFLPLIVRSEMASGPETYGILLGTIGAGAVLGGLALPNLRSRVSGDVLVAFGTFGMATALGGLAFVRELGLLMPFMLLAGASWISVISSLQVCAQFSLPVWVRARGLSVFLMTFMGSMAAGAATWGRIASQTSIRTALLLAVGFGAVAWLATAARRLDTHTGRDLSPSAPMPEPSLTIPVAPARGPVMVNVEYRIDPHDVTDFLRAMRDVRRMRLRNGAVVWGLYQDAIDADKFVEVFVDETWVEHLRQHQRLTVEDRDIKARAERFHRGEAPPPVKHLISRNPSKRRRRWQWLTRQD